MQNKLHVAGQVPMAERRVVKVEEIESVTHNFLWQASNESLPKTPTISKHLAATLVASVPDDGMSAFAKRMHCTNCGGLMLTSTVRLGKTNRRCKERNRVLRTCPACGVVNKTAGVPRGVQVTAGEQGNVEELRKELQKTKRRASENSRGGRGRDLPIAKPGSERKIGKKKKRKRSKSLDGASSKPDSKRNGLAASFLFEPL